MHSFYFLFLVSFLFPMSLANQHNEVSNGPQKKQVFKSTDDSFRKDYYLILDGQQVTVIGWETDLSEDTVYFKSTSTIETYKDESLHVTFDKFETSKSKINPDNWDTFTPDSIIKETQFQFFSSFFNGKHTDDQIEFLAIKHSYYSRADQFTFKRIH